MFDREKYIDGSGALMATPPAVMWDVILAAVERGELVPIWPNGKGQFPMLFDLAAFTAWRDLNCPLQPLPPVGHCVRRRIRRN